MIPRDTQWYTTFVVWAPKTVYSTPAFSHKRSWGQYMARSMIRNEPDTAQLSDTARADLAHLAQEWAALIADLDAQAAVLADLAALCRAALEDDRGQP